MWNMFTSRPAVSAICLIVSTDSVTCSAGIIAGQLRQRCTRSVPVQLMTPIDLLFTCSSSS